MEIGNYAFLGQIKYSFPIELTRLVHGTPDAQSVIIPLGWWNGTDVVDEGAVDPSLAGREPTVHDPG